MVLTEDCNVWHETSLQTLIDIDFHWYVNTLKYFMIRKTAIISFNNKYANGLTQE